MIFGGQPPRSTAMRIALAERAALSEHLVKLAEDGGLDEFDDQELMEFLQDVEREHNKDAVLQHALISNGVARDLPGTLAQSSMTRYSPRRCGSPPVRRPAGSSRPPRWVSG